MSETKEMKTKKTKPAAADGKSLVIVESPTKEKTLSKFLGKQYVVKSSYGHVRDLPKKVFGIDIENHFQPQYEILPKGKKIIPELKKISKECSKVYLATDYDREGESIAWHLAELLNVKEDKLFRITFHEITPEAIQEAIKSPRKVSHSLVDAQVARRVLDRIVGYRLSPLLWEKVRRGLSAGRVQSVVVRLICQREDEIEAFKSQEYWTIEVELQNTKVENKFPLLAQLVEWEGKKLEKLDVHNETEAKKITDHLQTCSYHVRSIVLKEKKRTPLPPFMTSTMAQEASRKLGFSAQRTMRIAQTLYEGVEIGGESAGLITYMRTDSLNIAVSARHEAHQYIEKQFGKKSLPEKPRIFKTKSKGAQEAHEAIRPTSAFRTPESLKNYLNAEQFKLYDLIWKRFIASQMTDALYDTVTVEIDARHGTREIQALLRASGSTLKDAGFLQVYGEESESEETMEAAQKSDQKRLPPLHEHELLQYLKMHPGQHFTEPPPRYNEASLIKILEQNGIGRPSTYAPIVQTILSRGYVRLHERRFYPTELGRVVNQQLIRHFPEIVDINFTAKIEEKLDEIAEGDLKWDSVIQEFYDPFEKDLILAKKDMKKVIFQPKDSGEICPSDQGKLLVRESRFGKYLSCENYPNCKYKVPLDIHGNKIVPEQTEEKCAKCGKPMVIKFSRWGKFLACTGYPDCKSTIKLDRQGNKVVRPEPKLTTKKCDKCGSPMLLRIGRRGPFLACSAFPKCRNIKEPQADDLQLLQS